MDDFQIGTDQSAQAEKMIITSGSFFYYYPKLSQFIKSAQDLRLDWHRLNRTTIRRGTKLEKELITFEDACRKLHEKHGPEENNQIIEDIYKFVLDCVAIAETHSNEPHVVNKKTFEAANKYGLSITRSQEKS